MQLTSHFNSEEFDCKDGTKYPIDKIHTLRKICKALEVVRAITGKSLTINSGYRTKDYNRVVGGAVNSQHVKGAAVDFVLEGIECKKLYYIMRRLIKAEAIPEGGLGLYKTWVHYDVRGTRARWKHGLT